MRVMVTGSCGFVGSHLTEALITAGHDVTAFCQYNARGDRGWCPKDVRTVFGDVRDLNCVAGAMAGQEFTFHLAALIGIPYSYIAHGSYIETNITGTSNVLQAAIPTGSRVIITSTSEVYGSAQTVPMTEDHPLSAQSPYAASKIAADQLALSFHRSFGTPVSILRPFNTYGPRQSARAVISQAILQILDAPHGGEIKLGNLDTFRDLTFVTDTAAAFIAMMENFQPGIVVNVGSEFSVKISALIDLIAGIIGKDIKIVRDETRVRPEASEVTRLVCDATRAAALLHWSPKTSLAEGLVQTIQWFIANRDQFPRGYQT